MLLVWMLDGRRDGTHTAVTLRLHVLGHVDLVFSRVVHVYREGARRSSGTNIIKKWIADSAFISNATSMYIILHLRTLEFSEFFFISFIYPGNDTFDEIDFQYNPA